MKNIYKIKITTMAFFGVEEVLNLNGEQDQYLPSSDQKVSPSESINILNVYNNPPISIRQNLKEPKKRPSKQKWLEKNIPQQTGLKQVQKITLQTQQTREKISLNKLYEQKVKLERQKVKLQRSRIQLEKYKIKQNIYEIKKELHEKQPKQQQSSIQEQEDLIKFHKVPQSISNHIKQYYRQGFSRKDIRQKLKQQKIGVSKMTIHRHSLSKEENIQSKNDKNQSEEKMQDQQQKREIYQEQ